MRDHEFRLLRTIQATIRGIQQDIRTISDQQERQYQETKSDKESRPVTPILYAELKVPENEEGQRQARDEKSHRQQVWLTWGTWLAFLAASIYAGITYSQREQMVESNRINRESLESVQRAFLVPHFSDPGQMRPTFMDTPDGKKYYMQFTSMWDNTGSTAAPIAIAGAAYNVVPDNEMGKFSFDIPAGAKITSTVVGPKSPISNSPIYIPEEIMLKKDSTKHILVWGWVSYIDIFFPATHPHLTEFCWEFDNTIFQEASSSKASIKGNIPLNSIIGFHSCDRHNCADDQCADYADKVKIIPKTVPPPAR